MAYVTEVGEELLTTVASCLAGDASIQGGRASERAEIRAPLLITDVSLSSHEPLIDIPFHSVS